MGVVLFLGFCLGFVGVVVFGALAIAGRRDETRRRKWNGWVLASLALGLLALVPFLLGVPGLD